MKQIRNDSEIDNQYSKMASIKTDYEAGIQSKVDIAEKHGISPVTLWRHAQKGNWSYGRMREDVLESMSEEALKRLGKLTGSIIEEHVKLRSIQLEGTLDIEELTIELLHSCNLTPNSGARTWKDRFKMGH